MPQVCICDLGWHAKASQWCMRNDASDTTDDISESKSVYVVSMPIEMMIYHQSRYLAYSGIYAAISSVAIQLELWEDTSRILEWVYHSWGDIGSESHLELSEMISSVIDTSTTIRSLVSYYHAFTPEWSLAWGVLRCMVMSSEDRWFHASLEMYLWID